MPANKKEIKVNHTDKIVPGIGEVPEVQQDAVQGIPEVPLQGEVIISAEIAHDISPVYLSEAEGWSGTLKKALETDDSAAWDKVFEIVYAIDQKKHKLPGLMKSKLARILERLP